MQSVTIGREKMKNYLYIFIGGAAGGLLRVMTIRADNMLAFGGMDLTILMINITGAFLLGLFLSAMARRNSLSSGLQLGVAVGFFGSFTTFSTLSMEAAGLLQTNDIVGLFFYIVVSCIAGLGASELGFRIGAGTGLIRIGRPRGLIVGIGLQKNIIPAVIRETEEE